MVADHIYDSLEIVCTKLGIQGQCVYRNTIFFTTVFNKTILIGFGFLGYRISSNNSWGRLFLFSHQKGAIIRVKAIIRGR